MDGFDKNHAFHAFTLWKTAVKSGFAMVLEIYTIPLYPEYIGKRSVIVHSTWKELLMSMTYNFYPNFLYEIYVFIEIFYQRIAWD